MCHECNWPMQIKSMNPIPPLIIPVEVPMVQPPIYNAPKEDKEVSGR